MYTLSKGPSKLAKFNRRGPVPSITKLESLDNNREFSRKKSGDSDNQDVEVSSPKPIFHNTTATSNRRMNNTQRTTQQKEDNKYPQHDEVVKYLGDSWKGCQKDLDDQSGKTTYYKPPADVQLPSEFVPFDLEAWWGTRMFNHLTQT